MEHMFYLTSLSEHVGHHLFVYLYEAVLETDHSVGLYYRIVRLVGPVQNDSLVMFLCPGVVFKCDTLPDEGGHSLRISTMQ